MSVPEQYLKYLCETNNKDIIEIPDKQFFNDFRDWLADNNIEHETTPLKLGVKLANLKTGAIE